MRTLLIVCVLAIGFGCATGDTAVDERKTESTQRMCKLGCAMSSGALYSQCAKKKTQAEIDVCNTNVGLGIDSCIADMCDMIEIDGKIGGIEVSR